MNDTLRNTLVVKVGDLLPQDKIFQQRWAAATGAQRILIVSNAHAPGWWSAENLPPFALRLQGIQFAVMSIGRFQAASGRWVRRPER